MREVHPWYLIYHLDNTSSSGNMLPLPGVQPMEEEEQEGQVASAASLQEGEMQMCEQYILGMLTTFESLPLERIHMNLSFLPIYSGSTADLKALLAKMMRDDKIDFVANEYTKK